MFKTLLERAWKLTNRLTHTKGSHWHDAEAAIACTENAISLYTSAVIQHIRGVPEQCPACGSRRLSPVRRFLEDVPEIEWERPTCDKCGWAGKPGPITDVAELAEESDRPEPDGDRVLPIVPLMRLQRHWEAKG